MPNFAKVRRAWPAAGFALIACLVLALVAFYLEPWALRGRFWDKYQQVQFGMTEKEVIAILGPPDSTEAMGMGPSTLAWFQGRQTVAVDFDAIDDRATEKRFRPGRSCWWVRERAKAFP